MDAQQVGQASHGQELTLPGRDIHEAELEPAGPHVPAQPDQLANSETIETSHFRQVEEDRANPRPARSSDRSPQALEISSGAERSRQLHDECRARSQECQCHT